jgi:3'-phosphoadenosine 5'-phosphosulfate (PAPS) 3'-phosphatase
VLFPTDTVIGEERGGAASDTVWIIDPIDGTSNFARGDRNWRISIEGLDEAAFLASRLHQNAAIRSLEVLGEAAGKISVAAQAARPEIAWREKRRGRHSSRQRGGRLQTHLCVAVDEAMAHPGEAMALTIWVESCLSASCL